jgi:hypothetical protein
MEVVVLNCWVTEMKETFFILEEFDQLCEVGERPRQAIHLVDHHRIDLSLTNVR